MTANHEYAPTTADIRNAVTRDESDWREAGAQFDRADRIQDPDAPTADELHADWLETRAGQTPEENHE